MGLRLSWVSKINGKGTIGDIVLFLTSQYGEAAHKKYGLQPMHNGGSDRIRETGTASNIYGVGGSDT